MAEENALPPFVESLLNLNDTNSTVDQSADVLADVTSINTCLTKESLRQLDRKLVRFDCQICDMFEEEYFVPIVPKKQSAPDASATS